MTKSSENLDAEVRERLELLWRWTRVVRHDLGNLLYPSDSTARSILDEPNWEVAHRYVRQTRTLVEMIDGSREALGDVGGSRRDDQAGSTNFKSWWGHFGPLASTIFPGGRPLRAVVTPETPPIAAPRSLVGGTMLSVLLAIELQVEGATGKDAQVRVEPARDRGAVAIHVEAVEGPWPALRAAAISTELAAKRGGNVDSVLRENSGGLTITFPAAAPPEHKG